jgi:hypothetical protein
MEEGRVSEALQVRTVLGNCDLRACSVTSFWDRPHLKENTRDSDCEWSRLCYFLHLHICKICRLVETVEMTVPWSQLLTAQGVVVLSPPKSKRHVWFSGLFSNMGYQKLQWVPSVVVQQLQNHIPKELTIFSKALMCICINVLGFGDSPMNQTDKSPCLLELKF